MFTKRRILWGILMLLLVAVTSTVLILLYVTTAVTQNTDTYVYDLPFPKGSSHKVVQGYGGLFSHKNIAAIDFAMPPGTPVMAARDGVIYAYKDDSDEGGPFDKYKRKANYIMIRHNDGSFGCYWHLQQHGVLVKKGKVKKGQPIGLSGATGQVIRPHLHFSVKQQLNYTRDAFRKTRFNTTAGVVFLANRTTYTNPK